MNSSRWWPLLFAVVALLQSNCNSGDEIIEFTCGNGVVDGNEVCDDGNTRWLDGCDGNCLGKIQRFIDNADGTVTDLASGFIWLQDGSCAALLNTNASGQAVWSDATAAAAALADGTCGLTDGSSAGDWRLPTVAAFFSLLTQNDCSDPAIDNTVGNACWSEGDPFVGVEAQYWSSEQDATQNEVWSFNIAVGGAALEPENLELHVWPVRGGE